MAILGHPQVSVVSLQASAEGASDWTARCRLVWLPFVVPPAFVALPVSLTLYTLLVNSLIQTWTSLSTGPLGPFVGDHVTDWRWENAIEDKAVFFLLFSFSIRMFFFCVKNTQNTEAKLRTNIDLNSGRTCNRRWIKYNCNNMVFDWLNNCLCVGTFGTGTHWAAYKNEP